MWNSWKSYIMLPSIHYLIILVSWLLVTKALVCIIWKNSYVYPIHIKLWSQFQQSAYFCVTKTKASTSFIHWLKYNACLIKTIKSNKRYKEKDWLKTTLPKIAHNKQAHKICMTISFCCTLWKLSFLCKHQKNWI